MNNKLFKQVRGDYCNICKTERSIELYSKFDKEFNYSFFLDQIDKGNVQCIKNLDNTELSYMQCTKCKECYFIDWRFHGIPKPLRNFNLTIDIFLNNIY